MRPRTDSKIYTLREGVGRHEHVSTYVASTLRQLPDLHSIPRQRGDQQAVPFSIVADIRWAGDPADELDLLARLVARHAGIGPARHENPATRDDDAVESAGALRDHARRLVAGLPAEHSGGCRFSGGKVRHQLHQTVREIGRRSQESGDRMRRRHALLAGLLCAGSGLAWQWLTVRFNYGGNWTALFCPGAQDPAPAR